MQKCTLVQDITDTDLETVSRSLVQNNYQLRPKLKFAYINMFSSNFRTAAAKSKKVGQYDKVKVS